MITESDLFQGHEFMLGRHTGRHAHGMHCLVSVLWCLVPSGPGAIKLGLARIFGSCQPRLRPKDGVHVSSPHFESFSADHKLTNPIIHIINILRSTYGVQFTPRFQTIQITAIDIPIRPSPQVQLHLSLLPRFDRFCFVILVSVLVCVSSPSLHTTAFTPLPPYWCRSSWIATALMILGSVALSTCSSTLFTYH